MTEIQNGGDQLPELPDPPLRGDEFETLTAFLDFYRAALLRKTWDLDVDQLSTPHPPSTLTLGGLLLHAALVEDSWFDYQFAGNEPREPWASMNWESDPDSEFSAAGEWAHDDLVAQFEESVERSRDHLAGAASLDQLTVRTNDDGERWSLRYIVVHLIEEYARHCGHADLLREALDGRTGDQSTDDDRSDSE